MDQSLGDRRLIWTVAVDPHYQQGAGLRSRGMMLRGYRLLRTQGQNQESKMFLIPNCSSELWNSGTLERGAGLDAPSDLQQP